MQVQLASEEGLAIDVPRLCHLFSCLAGPPCSENVDAVAWEGHQAQLLVELLAP